MKVSLSAFFIGFMFGLGLLISGMLNPVKVQGFLDITGAWDPSLMFVMIGGIGISLIGLRLTGHMVKPLLTEMFHHPVSSQIDRPLILGAVLFGVGWGIGGLCPGPAIAVLGVAGADGLIFMICMCAGLYLGRVVSSAISSKS